MIRVTNEAVRLKESTLLSPLDAHPRPETSSVPVQVRSSHACGRMAPQARLNLAQVQLLGQCQRTLSVFNKLGKTEAVDMSPLRQDVSGACRQGHPHARAKPLWAVDKSRHNPRILSIIRHSSVPHS